MDVMKKIFLALILFFAACGQQTPPHQPSHTTDEISDSKRADAICAEWPDIKLCKDLEMARKEFKKYDTNGVLGIAIWRDIEGVNLHFTPSSCVDVDKNSQYSRPDGANDFYWGFVGVASELKPVPGIADSEVGDEAEKAASEIASLAAGLFDAVEAFSWANWRTNFHELTQGREFRTIEQALQPRIDPKRRAAFRLGALKIYNTLLYAAQAQKEKDVSQCQEWMKTKKYQPTWCLPLIQDIPNPTLENPSP
jgi:hypothetical protein